MCVEPQLRRVWLIRVLRFRGSEVVYLPFDRPCVYQSSSEHARSVEQGMWRLMYEQENPTLFNHHDIFPF